MGRWSGRDLDGDDEAPPPEAEAAQCVAIEAKITRVAMEMRMVLLAGGCFSSSYNDETMMDLGSLVGRFVTRTDRNRTRVACFRSISLL